MYSWWKISLLLCIFGFLKELRPSEPYFYNYLLDTRWRNVTKTEVNQEVFPVGTYSYLVLLVVVFLITDLCRYKPLIVTCGVSGIIVWGMVLWTKSFLALQVIQVYDRFIFRLLLFFRCTWYIFRIHWFITQGSRLVSLLFNVIYGLFLSTEVAYYTYIYAKVEKEHFQLVTSHTRAAVLAGRGTSSVLGQLLVSFKLMNYMELNYITLAALIAANIWSMLLPSVKKSIYFHQSEDKQSFMQKSKDAFWLMKVHFMKSFCHGVVVKWSVLYALLTADFIQCQLYMQPLWSEVHQQDLKYNGVIEAGLTFLGFAMSLAAGYLKVNWSLHGNLTVVFCCLFQGSLLILSSQANHVLVPYISYIVFGGLHHFAVTIASAEIAKYLSDDSYGLVFGFNTFVGICTQSLLTVLFVKGLFNFAIRNQFLAYGVYHCLIAVPYFVLYVIEFTCKGDSYEVNKVVVNLQPVKDKGSNTVSEQVNGVR